MKRDALTAKRDLSRLTHAQRSLQKQKPRPEREFHISTRKRQRIIQFARQLMEQLRRDTPSRCNAFVKKVLNTKVIWPQSDLRFRTGWLIYNYTYAYKDLKGSPIALAEADVGPLLEVERIKRSRVNLNTTHLSN